MRMQGGHTGSSYEYFQASVIMVAEVNLGFSSGHEKVWFSQSAFSHISLFFVEPLVCAKQGIVLPLKSMLIVIVIPYLQLQTF